MHKNISWILEMAQPVSDIVRENIHLYTKRKVAILFAFLSGISYDIQYVILFAILFAILYAILFSNLFANLFASPFASLFSILLDIFLLLRHEYYF